MTRRNIVECDRCHQEIKTTPGGGGQFKPIVVTYDGKEYELHESCARKVKQILDGADVEVPP